MRGDDEVRINAPRAMGFGFSVSRAFFESFMRGCVKYISTDWQTSCTARNKRGNLIQARAETSGRQRTRAFFFCDIVTAAHGLSSAGAR